MKELVQEAPLLNKTKPHQKYYLVTEGATTKNGGIVRVKERPDNLLICDKRVALVGDYVQYADGSTATIISGAGISLLIDDTPIAISQSALDSGDIIEEAGILYKDGELCLFDDEPVPEGFLVKHWTAVRA